MSTDARGRKVAVVADSRLEALLPELAAKGYGTIQLPPAGLEDVVAAAWLEQVAEHVAAGDDVVVIGIDSSPTMGIDFTPSAPHWAGKPDIGEDDSTLLRGDGIYIEELQAELEERGLPMPRMTGIRHWFVDYDPDEERQRLVKLLTG